MGKLEIHSQAGAATFNGFEESFPRELTGIVPVKEFVTALEILNNNGIRTYVTYIWGVMAYAFVGLLPVIIVGIVEIFRWASFKKKLCKDLDKCLENINRVLSNRQVVISYKMDFSANVVMTVKYPDVPTSVPNQTVALEGGLGNAILVSPFADSMLIEDPRILVSETKPIDKNFKNVLLEQNPLTFRSAGFKGWKKIYDNKLYNYISYQEFNAMIDDINNTCIKPFNQTSYKFFWISIFLCIALVGVILIFPAMLWFYSDMQKHSSRLYKDIDEVIKKYNSIYNQRGLSIAYHTPNKMGILVSLNFNIPTDVGPSSNFNPVQRFRWTFISPNYSRRGFTLLQCYGFPPKNCSPPSSPPIL
ncbi:hypothetical protein DICPUDRAFT_79510 [Dictyostelium purpureum]|uniref:Golgin subfamily A member 7/ERF4 domain-containing protein n=1 Tax=Dictyostelium purpureum TaxID=5786 RepID=F0ZMT4_DICPU|nr:uncharacterized protein DICPUDRAFT_79510 [Dictyostelium purpureum]EGC34728.1 hypothetical protein DICPUDRAFT_79510 [Dictyostelium purpureum]|eukprot:XP_003288728.1 hypothetical protein DICPUDRAFT_79510 [Dictyostelium purpureum]